MVKSSHSKFHNSTDQKSINQSPKSNELKVRESTRKINKRYKHSNTTKSSTADTTTSTTTSHRHPNHPLSPPPRPSTATLHHHQDFLCISPPRHLIALRLMSTYIQAPIYVRDKCSAALSSVLVYKSAIILQGESSSPCCFSYTRVVGSSYSGARRPCSLTDQLPYLTCLRGHRCSARQVMGNFTWRLPGVRWLVPELHQVIELCISRIFFSHNYCNKHR